MLYTNYIQDHHLFLGPYSFPYETLGITHVIVTSHCRYCWPCSQEPFVMCTEHFHPQGLKKKGALSSLYAATG